MKKLLGLLAIAPMAITACGGNDGLTVKGFASGGYGDQMVDLATDVIDFAGAWSDARTAAPDGTDLDDITVIGVEETRVSNDGIQVEPNMDAHDMAAFQQIITEMIAEEQIQSEVFELFGHDSYEVVNDTNKTTSYLKNGKSVSKQMITTTPTLDTTNGGDLFDASNMLKSGEKLDIMFIPSQDGAEASAAVSAFNTHLGNKIGTAGTIEVSVAASYNAATVALENGTIDAAFLPVVTWAEEAPSTQFLLQAGRAAQVATLDFDGTDVWQPNSMTNQKLHSMAINEFSQLYIQDVTTTELAQDDSALTADQIAFKAVLADESHELNAFAKAVEKEASASDSSLSLIAGSYESFIYTKTDSELDKLMAEVYSADTFDKDFKIDINGLDLTYGYTEVGSGASHIYPELWIKRHMDATIAL